jgi:ABC-type nickel/cobalt efflux system permease component RcnA
MHTLRRLVILLLALWLPFQAVVAVAMPFCQDTPSPADSAPSHQHHGEHHGDSGHDDRGFPLDCNGCGPCHLACAPMVAMAANVVVLSASQSLPALPQVLPPACMLDQPHPPPLA